MNGKRHVNNFELILLHKRKPLTGSLLDLFQVNTDPSEAARMEFNNRIQQGLAG